MSNMEIWDKYREVPKTAQKEIKGGRFQITRIEPGHMRLKGIPAK